MKSFSNLLALPIPLLALVSGAAADDASPVAIRKLPPNANEKILAEHLAFAPVRALIPRVDVDISLFQEREETIDGTVRFLPAYGRHYYDADHNMLRRAAEALAFLERRASCPSGTNSCADVDQPNKCCQSGTYCVAVDDSNVGGVACCPSEASCGGGVGECPSGSTSCSAELGGGCCISGYVCQGQGCVPSASATPTSASATSSTKTSTSSKKTTEAAATSAETTAAETTTGSATGEAPLRPTSSGTITSAASTQTGCPTGYYGCLATHGGGCCRTDRDCNTYDCPAPSTTIITDGATIVVLATDAPPVAAAATSTCATGWFLCGEDAGSVAGCCPTGYDCGTASCFTVTASQTGKVQKEFPEAVDSSAARDAPWKMALGGVAAAMCLLIAM